MYLFFNLFYSVIPRLALVNRTLRVCKNYEPRVTDVYSINKVMFDFEDEQIAGGILSELGKKVIGKVRTVEWDAFVGRALRTSKNHERRVTDVYWICTAMFANEHILLGVSFKIE